MTPKNLSVSVHEFRGKLYCNCTFELDGELPKEFVGEPDANGKVAMRVASWGRKKLASFLGKFLSGVNIPDVLSDESQASTFWYGEPSEQTKAIQAVLNKKTVP